MSAIAAAAVRPSSPRSDDDSIWLALVNAAATWNKLDHTRFTALDWEKLIDGAQYHGVLPILAKRVLGSAVVGQFDSVLKDRFRRIHRASLVRGYQLASEVLHIVQAFCERGIVMLPYKGPVLAEQLWGDLTMRECADLDFLIPKPDVNRAGEILAALGYARVTPIPPHLRSALVRHASEEQFQHHETGLSLELQWSPAPGVFSLRLDAESLWKRTRSIPFRGNMVAAPSPEDLLLMLAIHGWKHNWSRLIWLGDVAQLLRCSHLDWDRLSSDCRRNRTFRIVLLALRTAARVFELAVPGQFKSADASLESLSNELVARLSAMNTCGNLAWHRCMLLARDRGADRMRQAICFLFTPGLGEYAACALPAWASAGYRAVRVARLLRLGSQKVRE